MKSVLTVKQACDLNNEGISLLIAGQSSRAVRSFQHGLAVLKKVANEVEDRDDSFMSVCEAKSPLRQSSSVPALQSQDGYIYDHALMLDEPACEEVNDILPTYSAVILFNLALATHVEGKLGRERSLKRASNLYEMCLQLLEDTQQQDSPSNVILTLLTLNNRAQIQYELCDYSGADISLGAMSCIMASNETVSVTLAHEDVEGLMLNMLLNTPTAARAA